MIKLIATDLDGTLLDDQKNIDPSFWEVLELLTKQGVQFVAASGRQYYMLLEQFEKVKDKIIILAENGTFVKQDGRELLLNSLPLEDARYFVKKARNVPGSDVILCGKESAYIESDFEPFVNESLKYYKRLKRVNNLDAIEDTILKVTLWDHNIAEHNCYQHFKMYENDFKVAVAGDKYMDITHKTASKGTAIEMLQKKFGITPEETLIFGDYLNDLDMMGVGYYSYAMKNAHPKIREISRFVTRFDNNHNGVTETIKELFGI